jgi:hypothetical protein
MRRPDELGQNSRKNWEEEDEKEKKKCFSFFLLVCPSLKAVVTDILYNL